MNYLTEQPGGPDKIAEAKAKQDRANLKRARVTAIIFGVISSFAMISLVYAYVQDQKHKVQIDYFTEEVKKLEDQNKKCEEAALRELRLSQEAVQQAYKRLEQQQSIKPSK